MLEGETPDDEENGEHGESHQLNRFAANSIDSRNRHPVTRNGTSADENSVTGSEMVQLMVNG